MKINKQWLYGIGIFIALLFVLNIGVNFWIKSKLPEIIRQKTNNSYDFTFNDLSFSFLGGRLSLDGIFVSPKRLSENHFIAKIEKADINGISFLKLLTKNDIIVSSVKISNPDVSYYRIFKENKDSIPSKTTSENSINIGKIKIENGKFKMFSEKKDTVLSVADFRLSVENIKFSSETEANKIPFNYEKVEFNISSFDYHPDKIYNLKSENISFVNKNLVIKNFGMLPKISRKAFVKQLKTEKDLYTISAQKISVNDFGFDSDKTDLFFRVPSVELDSAKANIFRSRIPADDTTKKPLYSKLLRELPFFMEIEKLYLKNSEIVYEEESIPNEPGKLTFSGFKAEISNIHSGYKKTELPDVIADIDCIFMHKSELKVKWTFNPLDKTEQFYIKGNMSNYNFQKANSFLKPEMQISVEGDADKIAFNFAGNDIQGMGNFMINYNDLKITAYKKNLQKENHFVGIIANLLVKKSTNGKSKEVEIKTVYRKQDRSFFNFFWNCVLQGLKQTISILD